MMSKEELMKIDTKNLRRLKSRLRKDLNHSQDQTVNEYILDYISEVDDAIRESNEFETVDENDLELEDYGDGVEYEVWKHKETGQLYNIPIERGSEEEEEEYGEVRITRFFDQASKVATSGDAKTGTYMESNDPINEDGDGGGAGVAMASQGNVTGMGNVVASQPASTPGAAFTGDGTVGSGDIGFPLGVYTKKGATGQKYVKHGKKKDHKLVAKVEDFLRKHKKDGKADKKIKYGNVPEKVMNFQNFLKSKTTKVSKAA